MMMSLKSASLVLAVAVTTTTRTCSGFSIVPMSTPAATRLFGYLDDLSSDLNGPDANPDVYGESKQATDYDKAKMDRAGPSDWSGFVDFDEFDGGDGRKLCFVRFFK